MVKQKWMTAKIESLLPPVSASARQEVLNTLLQMPGFRLEQIVSNGEASAEGFWYNQNEPEWVLLMRGEAVLEFEKQEALALKAGDSLLIPAHCKHRVKSTSQDAVWLALHFSDKQKLSDEQEKEGEN